MDPLRRHRCERVRSDMLHRVGHHQKPHSHALHEAARERFHGHAHHGDPVHVRGQQNRQIVALPHRRSESPQIERGQGISAGHLPHPHGSAEPFLHTSARRLLRVGGIAFGRLGKQLVELAHPQRACGIQIPLATRTARDVAGFPFGSPGPISRKLRRPHFALHRPRSLDNLHIARVEAHRILDRMIKQFFDRRMSTMIDQRVLHHSIVLPPKNLSATSLFTLGFPHATLREATKARAAAKQARASRTHIRSKEHHGRRSRRAACPPSARPCEKRAAREPALHERCVRAPAPFPRARCHAGHRRPSHPLRPRNARAPLRRGTGRTHSRLSAHRAAQRVPAPLPRPARGRCALGRRMRHRRGTHHLRTRPARHPHRSRRAPARDPRAHRRGAAAGNRRNRVPVPAG